MQHYSPLKFLYVAFLGLMLALFTGVLISVAYPAPTPPSDSIMPKRLSEPSMTGSPTPAEIAQQEAYERAWEEHREKQQTYDRNVSLLSLGSAVLMLVLGLTLSSKITIIADGLLLGSVFTTFYSIIRGFSGESQLIQLIVITVGLVIALTLGYVKFITPEKRTK